MTSLTRQEAEDRARLLEVTRYEVHLTTRDGRQVVQVYDAKGEPYNPTR